MSTWPTSPSTRAGRVIASLTLRPAGSRFAAAVAAAALLLMVAGFLHWAIGQREPSLYRVGLVAPFEGLYRETGYDALDATREQVEQLNARLSDQGVQFQVWAVDDGNDPALAVARAHELAADPLVLLVVGHFTPETTAAAAPIYEDAGLTVISPVAVAGEDAAGGTLLSLSPAPSGLLAAMSAWAAEGSPAAPESGLWVAGTGSLPAGGNPLWPGAGGVGTPSGERLAVNGPLRASERALVTGVVVPSEVILPYSYCPAALLATVPHVSFWLATTAGSPGEASAVAASAARHAGLLLEQVVREASPTRGAVAEAAAGWVTGAGWVRSGPAWYDPTLSGVILACEPLGR